MPAGSFLGDSLESLHVWTAGLLFLKLPWKALAKHTAA